MLAGGLSNKETAAASEDAMRVAMGLTPRSEEVKTEDRVRIESGDIRDGDVLVTLDEHGLPVTHAEVDLQPVLNQDDIAYARKMKQMAQDAKLGGGGT